MLDGDATNEGELSMRFLTVAAVIAIVASPALAGPHQAMTTTHKPATAHSTHGAMSTHSKPASAPGAAMTKAPHH
jgi:hypothetical protein